MSQNQAQAPGLSQTPAHDLYLRLPQLRRQQPPPTPPCPATLYHLKIDAITAHPDDKAPWYQCSLCGYIDNDIDFAHRPPLKEVPGPVELPPLEECGVYGCKAMKPIGTLMCATCYREMQDDPDAFK